jgi:hypothetical protein
MFGDCRDGLEYPELVKAALLKLRPVADIRLPFFPTSFESEMLIDQRQPAAFTDSQDESSSYSGFSSLESAFKQHLEPHLQLSIMRRIRQSTPQVIIEVGRTQSRKRSREATPETSNRKSRKRDVTPRLRHDDSQVQFEAIESSPMADRVVDSQLLTEKQKEVKERQQADAAMFPDLRSSPLPKAKSVEKSVEDPELPVRRSSSKIREKLSPNVLRQTTPNLVLPSDDDNQVPSSPTPTRSLRGETQAPDPPSSPPEAVVENNPDYGEDISSSPPEVSPEPELDITMSVDPSAQMNPYAAEISDPTISTFESTPIERGSSPADPSAQLLATEAEQQQRIASLDDRSTEESLELASDPVTNPQLPGTPTRNATESPANQQTPRTPQFVDARSSPASSDKISANGDVFEDAVSSPRLNIPRTRPKQSSSLLSDADDSSMLRVVAEYDEGSGCGARHVSFAENKENQERRSRASSPKQTSSVEEVSPRKLSLRNRSVQQSPDKGPGSTASEIQKPSSDPSLIPETPAAKSNEMSMKEIIDGVEIGWDDTIVVDISSLESLAGRPTAKSRGLRKKLTTYSNKRKLIVDDTIEVPESSNVTPSEESKRKRRLAEDTSEVAASPDSKAASESMPFHRRYCLGEVLTFAAEPPLRTKSPKKTPKPGRPKRVSQTSEQEPDLEAEQSQSSSVDLDVPMKDAEIEDSTTDVLTSSAKEATIDEAVDDAGGLRDESHEILPTTEDVSMPDEDIDMAATVNKLLDIAQTAHESVDEVTDAQFTSEVQATSPDVERVEETVINESAFKGESSPAAETPESEIDSSAEIIPATTSDAIDTSSAASARERIHSGVAEEAQPEVSAFQNMKDKLESLIDDLRSAALGREEKREIEDLLDDAKEQLYGAGRRGRGRERSEMNM